jgi:hypothetical protein
MQDVCIVPGLAGQVPGYPAMKRSKCFQLFSQSLGVAAEKPSKDLLRTGKGLQVGGAKRDRLAMRRR